MAFKLPLCCLLVRRYSKRKNGAVKNLSTGKVQKFSWEEIKKITKNFRVVIGVGGFSTVYRAVLADQRVCVVKVQIRKTERLRGAYRQELHALLRARHDNLVNLIGYCDESEAGVLVLEYVKNGNLHDTLHADDKFLAWPRRFGIACQIASALQYLHEVCEPAILHCDIKSSNILLDENYNAKLCDFGFSRTGDNSYLTKSGVMGSPGYIDPHCFRSGIVCKKTDVYSFGVLLLELITGMEAFCGEKRELLAVLASPFLEDPSRLCEVIDCRLNGCYDHKQAASMARIAALCICGEPELRPSMTEVVRLMNE
ncbi:hypothetical protein SUGI_1170560 [Cryptomeria japonica]|uniref:salt tolerance receptor-like cytoplasmic kinase 1 n=1 Tax=Cryptomeria japonica TaxID=3369 RepID=UPI0024149640|nr:salt tolerance receptor-like cytoplasmic kinase 1 [Cryptomeria japonica]GLJ54501.1 hypothetical protein SUGI_1170560 [Cryptomeria japonica]